MSLYGIKKSVMLLMLIGIDRAAEVLNQLTIVEIKKIIKYMVHMSHMLSEEKYAIAKELQTLIGEINKFHFFNKEDIFSMLKKAFGENTANIFLDEIIELDDIYSMIKKFDIMNVNELFQLIKNEHLQIITIIIMNISYHQAAQILEIFSKKQRFEIMLRMSTFVGLPKSGKIELVYVLKNILKRYQKFLNNEQGIKITAKILKLINIQYERNIINEFSGYSKSLTKKILNEMMLFKNIINIEDKHVCWLIQNIKLDIICTALSNVDYVFQEKFIKNMSKNDVIYLQQFFLKNITLSVSKIKHAQNYILKKVKFILNKEMLIENNRKEQCLI